MFSRDAAARILTIGSALLIGGLPSASLAQTKEATKGGEPALLKNHDDKGLTWSAAPEFMPKGTELTVLHGDPAKNNADLFLRIPAKGKIPEHWHTSAERMILISGELHVNYAGQETAVMKAGSYAYGPAKLKHSGVCVSETPCVLFIAFEEPVDAIPVAKAGTPAKK